LNEWKKIVEHNAGVELAKRERHPIENFREPVTVAGTGGTDGGGVPVSELGDAFIKNYRKLERDFATFPARRLHANIATVIRHFKSDTKMSMRAKRSAHIVSKLSDDLFRAPNRLSAAAWILDSPSTDVSAQPRELEKRLP